MNNGTYFTEESCIHFFGHLHKYCVYNNTDNTFSVLVPTLSDINTDFPTALDVVFNFDKGTISEINIKQVYLVIKILLLVNLLIICLIILLKMVLSDTKQIYL